jgi:hypothetical protein
LVPILFIEPFVNYGRATRFRWNTPDRGFPPVKHAFFLLLAQVAVRGPFRSFDALITTGPHSAREIDPSEFLTPKNYLVFDIFLLQDTAEFVYL